MTRNNWEHKFKGICPQLPCDMCAIKDSDPYSTPGRDGKCPFYAKYPNGYAGGYIVKKNKLIKVADMTCPRTYLFCTECPFSEEGKACYRFIDRQKSKYRRKSS